MDRDRIETLNRLLPEAYRIRGGETVTTLTGGSDRFFYRITGPEGSFVIMFSPEGDPELADYLEVQAYLARRWLGVPGIFFTDREHSLVVMEDIGDRSLEKEAADAGGPGPVRERYHKVIEYLVRFQYEGYAEHRSCPLLASRSFDSTMLRWETWYFRTHFLGQYCSLEPEKTSSLIPEFGHLARAALTSPQLLMHRDFQSQNIFFLNGEIRIVDFQAARPGLPAYDLASLVLDPYTGISLPSALELVEYYCSVADRRDPGFNKPKFLIFFQYAALQRLMQALGAYAYLSRVKGKTEYRAFIPRALESLKAITARTEEFPQLKILLDSPALT